MDRIHFDVTRPKETADGLKVPVIMEASPYYANLGPNSNWSVDLEIGAQTRLGEAQRQIRKLAMRVSAGARKCHESVDWFAGRSTAELIPANRPFPAAHSLLVPDSATVPSGVQPSTAIGRPSASAQPQTSYGLAFATEGTKHISTIASIPARRIKVPKIARGEAVLTP